MNTLVRNNLFDWSAFADLALKNAARFWFVVAVTGQLIFAAYIALFYGASAMQGNWAAWGKVMPRGYIPGDTVGNTAIATHLFLAFLITVGGAIQLIPQVRAAVPTFHRWNGRVYVVSAIVASIGGLYLVWMRGTVGDLSQHLGTTLNALLIMLCAVMAWRCAMARDFVAHRRWALRLFLVVSGVWFFRVGLMLWLLIHQAAVGFDSKTFQGPFLTFLAFAQTLVPLAILELYLRAQRSANPVRQLAVAAGLATLTFATGAGIFGATMMMWLPRM